MLTAREAIFKEIETEGERRTGIWGEHRSKVFYFNELQYKVDVVRGFTLDHLSNEHREAHLRDDLIQLAELAISLVECLDRYPADKKPEASA